MKTISVNIFTFDELSDKAKEVARDWYRSGGPDYDWWEYAYGDAKTIGLKITGFDLRGLCEGSLIGTALETIRLIKKNHGKDCETYKTALRYEPTLRETLAKMEAENSGLIEEEAHENTVHEFLLDLCEDYRIILEKELEYLQSNESVDENIRLNEYEFLESGKRS